MDSVFHTGWVYWEGASLEVQEHLEVQARNSVALSGRSRGRPWPRPGPCTWETPVSAD